MALSTPSGSLTPPSLPHSSDNLVEPADPQTDMEDKLDRQAYVKDTYHNKTALNVDRDAGIIDAIKGFAAGTPILVTWFHIMESTADKQSNYGDLSFMSDSVNYGYHRINNFELRLQEEMSFSYDTENVVSELTGNGLILPGFKAKIGDLFTYSIEAGILGLFKVTGAPQRLSIRTGTSHMVPFKLVTILTTAQLTEIMERVREESWFDKQRFLNEEAALLTRDDVMDLTYVRNKRIELSYFYGEQFFDGKEYQSLVRPDGIYDPYIVDFVKHTVDFGDLNIFIQRLVPEAPHHEASFWEKLIDPKKVSWNSYAAFSIVKLYELSPTSSKVTSLINRKYIELMKELSDPLPYDGPYISENIGNFDTVGYTPFDTLVMFWMEYQVIDVTILYDLIEGMYDLEPIDQFYQIPVYLFLLWILEQSIHTGEKIRLAKPDQLPYLNIEFTQPGDYMVGDVLTVLSPGSKIVGLLDDSGNPVFPEPLDVTYTSDTFSIDMTAIKAELGIVGDLPGTWTVVVSNSRLLIT